MVWYGLVWFGMVWFGKGGGGVLCGMVSYFLSRMFWYVVEYSRMF